jgi:hypothetical protein
MCRPKDACVAHSLWQILCQTFGEVLYLSIGAARLLDATDVVTQPPVQQSQTAIEEPVVVLRGFDKKIFGRTSVRVDKEVAEGWMECRNILRKPLRSWNVCDHEDRGEGPHVPVNPSHVLSQIHEVSQGVD